MTLKSCAQKILFAVCLIPMLAMAGDWQSAVIDEQLVLLSWGKSLGGTVKPTLMVDEAQRRPYSLSAITASSSTALLDITLSKPACIALSDRLHSESPLTELCIVKQNNGRWSATLAAERVERAYGWGQEHDYSNKADGDLLGRTREPGDSAGNRMVYQNGGAVGNTQIPVLYLLGKGGENLALFFDHPRPMTFDLETSPLEIEGYGDSVRVFVIAGQDLPALRSRYLALTGRPPVPPKAMFGLWLSEYGFDNWQELDGKLQSILLHRFPISGVVLDLQWFGGIRSSSDNTSMGSLTWDNARFPEHKQKIATLKAQGIGVMLIEEPYVGGALTEHKVAEKQGALVLACPPPCTAVELTSNPWWGIGGMLDFSNEQGASFWHDYRREALIDEGITAHWTDLGEPEAYSGKSWYAGVEIDGQVHHDHKSVNNLYNLLWSRSIYQGYQRNGRLQRPFIMSRSGTAGSQRYGVAMWSGDIGASLDNLQGQFNVQSQMSLSGIDYFGSDIGGFHGNAGDEAYTQWLAASLFTDVPVRPHTQNLCNCKQTSPDAMGDFRSNLYNLKQRYSLEPYYYTAAHLAWREGQALVAPLVYRYQEDEQARLSGRMKLIGRDILLALDAGEVSTQVYLPKGDWFDYRLGTLRSGNGLWSEEPLYLRGLYRLPVFIRAGAIVPRQGRQGGLDLLAVLDKGHAEGILIEDDGVSTAYQNGAWRETRFTAQTELNKITFSIHPSQSDFIDVVKPVAYRIELVNLPGVVKEVWFGKQKLTTWEVKDASLILHLPDLARSTGVVLSITLADRAL